MYTFSIIPKPVNPVKIRLEFYDQQAHDLLQTHAELSLAYELVKAYSRQDAQYYSDMQAWLNTRFDYVLPNALTFLPSAR